MGHVTIYGSLDGRGGDQVFSPGVAAGMENLQANLAASVVHGSRDQAMILDLTGLFEDRDRTCRQAVLARHKSAGDDQGDTATGALGVKFCHASMAVGNILEAGVHRSHQHPILQAGKSKV